jgi:DNA-binding transcriptional MerR regulator
VMFRKAKGLLAQFGFKGGDHLDTRNKEIQEALALWRKHKETPLDQLDPYVAEKIKTVKHALLQLKRDQLTPGDMKLMMQEMNGIMNWFRSEGNHITDLTKISKAGAQKFKKAQGLLTLWGYKIDPSHEQLKEIAGSLVFFRRNKYNPEIFDQYDGEEGAKFKRLQHAMVDWRLKNAESSELFPDKGTAIAREIRTSLVWWSKNGEDFNPKTARPADVFSAGKMKLLLDMWIPPDAEQTFT